MPGPWFLLPWFRPARQGDRRACGGSRRRRPGCARPRGAGRAPRRRGGRCPVSGRGDRRAMAPDGWTFAGLRALFSVLPEPLFRVAGRALMLVDWERSHRFCGRCGTATRAKEGERARECPACGRTRVPEDLPGDHRGRHPGRPAPARAAPPVRAAVHRGGGVRGAGRDARGVRAPGGARGDRPRDRRAPLLREPALAVPAFAHGRASPPSTSRARSGWSRPS